jgi:hypothetical protein
MNGLIIPRALVEADRRHFVVPTLQPGGIAGKRPRGDEDRVVAVVVDIASKPLLLRSRAATRD